MKIVVFGATGGTGTCVVEQALTAGHEVIAVARRPESVTIKHDLLQIQVGDVLDADSVASAIQNTDAVLSAFGPPNNKQPGTLMSQGIANIVAGCTKHGVKRFVFESGLMCSDGTGLSWFSKLGVAIAGRLYSLMRADKRVAEAAIQATALDWVIIRPPALSHAPATGRYRTGVNAAINAAKQLPHADVADFMLRCTTDAAVVRTIQNIGL